jgi:hypothetical protein
MTILRRIRGVLGTAAIWALAWVIILAPLVLLASWDGDPERFLYLPRRVIASLLLAFGGWGALHGALFAVILMTANRFGLNVLTSRRLMAAGAIAGMAVPLCSALSWWWWLFLPFDPALTVFVTALTTGLGSTLAAVTFRVVRPRVRTVLPPGDDAL